MLKKIASIALALILILGIFSFSALAAPLIAKPTASTVLVDGKNVAFDAYNINNNNYFKLRDLAYVLNGTVKQFEIGWDSANNSISLTSAQPYTPDGGEMASKGSGNKTPIPTTSKIFLDGLEVQFTAYKIEGNNYFKLRDIGQAFNFGVDWDGARNTIVIDTSKEYTPETVALLTEPEARKIAQTWLDHHPVREPNTLEQEYEDDIANGEEYYTFYIDSWQMYWFSILVNKKTGDLLARTISDGEEVWEDIEPLDDWYNKYYGD